MQYKMGKWVVVPIIALGLCIIALTLTAGIPDYIRAAAPVQPMKSKIDQMGLDLDLAGWLSTISVARGAGQNSAGDDGTTLTTDNDPTGDPDGDGVINEDEYANHTDPSNPDTDGDGLGDQWEIENGLDPTGAVVQDAAEQRTATGTSSADSDGDKLPNTWEIRSGLDSGDPTGSNGAAGDPDGDGLINLDEWANGTDPSLVDTDGDGLLDQWEIEQGLDPLDGNDKNGANGDLDGDGLTNLEEVSSHTDPSNPDTDGDMLPDQWEVAFDLDPTDNTGVNGANGDPDGDGFLNTDEWVKETNPRMVNTSSEGPEEDSDHHKPAKTKPIFLPKISHQS